MQQAAVKIQHQNAPTKDCYSSGIDIDSLLTFVVAENALRVAQVCVSTSSLSIVRTPKELFINKDWVSALPSRASKIYIYCKS